MKLNRISVFLESNFEDVGYFFSMKISMIYFKLRILKIVYYEIARKNGLKYYSTGKIENNRVSYW